MKKQILAAVVIISAGILAGCGGSSGMNSSPISRTSISGKVADGYLVGATVFMDKNGNYQLDAGEPSATTDATGAYTLMNVDSGDVGNYPIVALAIKNITKDLDTNSFLNMSYVLSMPATAVSGTVSSNFISPMSSQLREMMETGTYTSMQEAMSSLSTSLGLSAGTNMLSDYVAAGNTTMHTAAQNMANLMGSQMDQVLATSGSATTVEVNRYRGMMGTIFSNISSVKGSGSNSQTAILNLSETMMTNLTNITPGQAFRNMSTYYRGGMMGSGGTSTIRGMM